jgi:hypothetical protein
MAAAAFEHTPQRVQKSCICGCRDPISAWCRSDLRRSARGTTRSLPEIGWHLRKL